MFFETRYRTICPDFTSKVHERKALRVNTLKIDDCALIKRLRAKKVKLDKIPYLQHGYYYDASFSLGATPEYLQGYYYLQGAASQVVAELLAPKPSDAVLDMAAAPGSKATHIAQLMENKGTLVCLDSAAQRLAALRNNCERLLVTTAILLKKDSRFSRDLDMKFDRVLLDAPCSGNFCSEPGWFEKRSLADIQQNGRVQRELLKAAHDVTKSGGVIVYSTCSLEPEEDELVINWLLEKYDDVELVDLEINSEHVFTVGDPGITEWDGQKLNPALSRTRRFWPHKTHTEGFFVAKLRKK